MAGTCNRCKVTPLVNKRVGGKVITWCNTCDGAKQRAAATTAR
ncbi:MAG TPA: hypothetical protein VNZ52_09305 [Candidatus Thermoplasmatota archaeon]|nr:hypothetical protein [Candidatus Thermoplasmatota archaeon]